MADYGIKISKVGTNVTDVPTETTIKNFTILSTVTCPKVLTQAVVSTNTNVAHGLGFAPLWDAYFLQNSSTEAHPIQSGVTCDSTYLYVLVPPSYKVFYVIYLDQP